MRARVTERTDRRGLSSRGETPVPRPLPHISEPENKKDTRAEVRRSKTEDEGAGGSRTPKSATADGGGMRFFVGESV